MTIETSFTCTGCGATFEKADRTHGIHGLCCQCEIATGIVELHADPEKNRMERERTGAMLQIYKTAFPQTLP